MKTLQKNRDGYHAIFYYRETGIDLEALREIWDEDVYQIDAYDLYGRWVVDVGAHIGGLSLRGALAGAKVLAIEPDSDNVDLLNQNLALNNCTAEVVLGAASFEDGPVSIWTDPETGMAHTGVDSSEVDGFKLSTLFDKHKIADCALLKVDIEGWEYEIIDDLALILPLCERVCFETHALEDPSPLGELLTTLLLTHSVNTFGNPHTGGQIYARRNGAS
jgi:FkbM family methyltransferase